MPVISFFPRLAYWPDTLARDRTWAWELSGQTAGGGKTLSGIMQVGRLDGGGFWRATLDDIQVSGADHVRAWRALAAQMEAGVTPIVITARDTRHFPAPLVGGARLVDAGPIGCNDDAGCSDGSFFQTPTVDAELIGFAALRSTRLNVTVVAGSALRGGEVFSIEHGTMSHRLYVVASVTAQSGYTELTIRPPLRGSVEAGTRLEFDWPKCVMQLADPGGMTLTQTRREHGEATVRLVESFPPWSLLP